MKRLELLTDRGDIRVSVPVDAIEGVKRSGRAIQLDLVGNGLLYIKDQGATFGRILAAMTDHQVDLERDGHKAGELIS